MLASKRALRHCRVHFFDISTSKSGPRPRCLEHFDFKICFASQQRAIFDFSPDQVAPHPPLYRAYPPGPQNIRKHSVSRVFDLFVAHLGLLSSDSFSSLIFFFLPFSSLTLPTSAFPSVQNCRTHMTSKLPSDNQFLSG